MNVCVCLSFHYLITFLSTGDHSTIGGLLCALAGKIPSVGDVIIFAGFQFTVLSLFGGRRIGVLRAERVGSVQQYNNVQQAVAAVTTATSIVDGFDEDAA